jgi:septal ring-binding cell division protein DamX
LRNVLQGKPLSAEKAASAATPASAPLASGPSAAVAAPVASAPAAAAAPKPPEEVETIVPSTPRAKATPATAPDVAPEPKPVDDAQNPQNQAGQAWVRQMPAGTFLVQHTIVPSYAEAGNYLQAHANLKRARIVANYLPNQPGIMFSVVSGPFASLAEASAYAESGGIPKDPQIRSARFMKEQFSPSIAGAFGQKKAEVKR